MSLTRAEAEKLVRSWGFSHVFTWTDSPKYHYNPHSHSSLTTHLILSGSLTIAYPTKGQVDAEKETFGVGGRIDVDANQVHEVWIGEEGCTYVIGE
ncbi:hypothetical protein JAAARDRAFT_27591 [Jaapia argillacea MUCL 33604]|uniref:Cupin 2 conserved barrel domain-containing protein n=1 Tax=Jaapia argillacea MUCL 33604 TaxID=933084 RepID=A0A067QCS5_9AGAM|nr:hypothetical protein JAAARDRAFT_27591 [Jaapia argillacea MUCL 33604]